MVYISSSALNASMRQSILSAQSQLAEAQTELSSGTYADLGLHLGASSGQFLLLSQQQSSLSAFTASNAIATTRLASTSTVLSNLHTTADTFLASLTTASTAGGLTSGLPESAAGNLQALIAGLNTTVAGQSVFGGINTDATPISAYGTASPSKQAVDAAFSAAFGTTQTSQGASAITASQMSSFLNGSFATLFDATGFSSTWSTATDAVQSTEVAPGQSVTSSVSANATPLRQLAQAYTMVSEFAKSPISAGAQQAVVKAATSLITQALSGLTDVQASVGIAQSTVTSAGDQISAQSALLTTQTGTMQDVDVYALNTRIVSLQTEIQASYELTNQLQKLSLVNYFSA